MTNTFIASFDGVCDACGWELQAGEKATYEDDQVIHADCSTEGNEPGGITDIR